MKLGDDSFAWRHYVETGDRDPDTGNPKRTPIDVLVQWASVTPTYAAEMSGRMAPAIAGARVLAPAAVSGIGPDDQIIWPLSGRKMPDGTFVREADGTFAGELWQVDGEIGRWSWGCEFQLRRET